MGNQRPKVGVGVLVFKDDQILLGKRSYSHGAGTWCPPGGHLEFGETPESCAARELYEETGLKVIKMHRGPWTNDCFREEGKHYISIYIVVTAFEGDPKVTEPEKCLCWEWFDVNNLPDPLFLAIDNLRKENSLRELVHQTSLV